MALQEKFPNLKFVDLNCGEISTKQLGKRLQGISKRSVFIYMCCSKDSEGTVLSPKKSMEIISENLEVPCFAMTDETLGYGALGGYILSYNQLGRIAGKMANNYYNGLAFANTGLSNDMSFLYVAIDEEIARKYNVNIKNIKEAYQVINHKPGFLERNKDKIWLYLILLVLLITGIVLGIAVYIRHARDMAELKRARNIMENASEHDFLTGLPNRNKFMHDLGELINNNAPCTVIMIDIDNFKGINDNYGHQAGDEVLVGLADRLKNFEATTFMAYRYAGDEFIAIVRSIQKKIVERSAQQCKEMFVEKFQVGDQQMKLTGSIGLALYPNDTADMEQLIFYADEAMYRVKKGGKNDYEFYNSKNL